VRLAKWPRCHDLRLVIQPTPQRPRGGLSARQPSQVERLSDGGNESVGAVGGRRSFEIMTSEAREASEIKHAISADGTSIGWRQLGTGPAIVIVHGSIATGEQWLPVAQILAEQYTVMLVDRRGRGLSGDAQNYHLSTEVADLDAVLTVAGAGVRLLGHSYGAIVAAATATAGADISALVLYEPPLPVNGADSRQSAVTSSIAAAVAAGDHDGALSMMLSGRVGMAEAEVANLRRTPKWAEMVETIPPLPRELHVIDGLVDDLDRFTTIKQGTLLLRGKETARKYVDVTRFLIEKLPTTTLVEIPGQGHFAHVAVPDTVADAVRSFLGRA
jgi:pimeloyl-ACP methyl ester carboxylesterase